MGIRCRRINGHAVRLAEEDVYRRAADRSSVSKGQRAGRMISIGRRGSRSVMPVGNDAFGAAVKGFNGSWSPPFAFCGVPAGR